MQINQFVFKRKLLRPIGVLMLLFLLLFAFRKQIMQFAGNRLIYTHEFDYVEHAFVLSGQAKERGTLAAELSNQGKIGKIICTGANQPPDLAVYESDLLESDLTVMQISKLAKNPDLKVSALKVGTSTKEEADAILEYCLQNKVYTALIISSLFHTRRIHNTFSKKFRKHDITILIAGAESEMYDEKEWWKSEYGLIALNNEYIKLTYYRLKGY